MSPQLKFSETRIHCPICGKFCKIRERGDVSVADTWGDFESEKALIRCKDCGAFEVMKIVTP